MSVLTFENIYKEYRSRMVLEGVSLRVEKGERLALIGPNGSGKSTLLKIALGMEVPDRGRAVIARGIKVGYISQDTADASGKGDEQKGTALHYEKAYRLEEQMRSVEVQLEQLAGGDEEEYNRLLRQYSRLQAEYEAMDGYSVSSRLKATLLGLGLREDVMGIPVDKLSGGEKMRVAIAKVLLEAPDLIILDEPTNHLDMKAVEWLEGFLKKFDGGVLVVSHDRYFLDQVATRLAELDQGHIVERKGGYTNYIAQKQKRREFLASEQDRLKREIKNQTLVAQQLKSMNRIKAANSRMKAVERLESELSESRMQKAAEHAGKENALSLSFDTARHISAEIAKAEGLRKHFGNHVLFDHVDFLIRGREHVGIVGDNGSGKSTLLNILRGMDEDFTGVARLGPWVRYAYLSQNISFSDEQATVMEEIRSRKEMESPVALDYLARYQFYGDDVNKVVGVLSGGEKVRLYMACIMLEMPDCLIMDEPTNHLDIDAREALEAALQDFNGSIIAVSHDRYFLTRCVDRILEISNGHILSYEGNYEMYKQKKQQEERKGTGEGETKKNIAVQQDSKDRMERKSSAGAGNSTSGEKMTMQQIEADIMELEEKMKALEASFDQATPPEVYREYDSLAQEIQRLYGLWESLM